MEVARGTALVSHSAAGLALGPFREDSRLLRAAEGFCWAAVAAFAALPTVAPEALTAMRQACRCDGDGGAGRFDGGSGQRLGKRWGWTRWSRSAGLSLLALRPPLLLPPSAGSLLVRLGCGLLRRFLAALARRSAQAVGGARVAGRLLTSPPVRAELGSGAVRKNENMKARVTSATLQAFRFASVPVLAQGRLAPSRLSQWLRAAASVLQRGIGRRSEIDELDQQYLPFEHKDSDAGVDLECRECLGQYLARAQRGPGQDLVRPPRAVLPPP
jgi:hypothetical protein